MNQEILKRAKRTVNLKSGLNNNNDSNTTFETRVYIQKLRVSLKKNLRKFFFNQRQTGDNSNVDRFFQDHVLIDSHYFVTVREQEELRVVPVNYTEGRHSIRNGLSQNLRNRRGITSIEQNGVVPHNVMALVFVQQYSNGIHEGHAICAFKHGNVLYCFNPWGSQYVLKNMHTGTVLPDNAIWEHLRARYRCDYAMVYTGTNFQAENTKGICVGLSVDFGTYMYTHLMLQSQKNFPDLSSAINGIPGSRILFSHEYNGFVESLFSSYIGAFGNDCGSTMIDHVFHKLTSNAVSSRTSSINENNRRRSVNVPRVVQKLMNQDPVFAQTMNNANWKTNNVTNKQRNARASAREMLKTFDNRLQQFHGNTLNSELRKFVT